MIHLSERQLVLPAALIFGLVVFWLIASDTPTRFPNGNDVVDKDIRRVGTSSPATPSSTTPSQVESRRSAFSTLHMTASDGSAAAPA
jgi:hypothetical protein